MQAKSKPQAIQRMDALFDGIAFLCQILTGLALVVLTVIFGWLVYGRYVLNATPTWVEQMALLLVMAIAFLGAAVGVHKNTHLAVTLLRSAVPDRLRLVLLGASDFLMAGFGGLMLWYGAQLTAFKWGSLVPLLQVPEGLRSLPLAIGGGLILLFSVGHIIRLVLGLDQRVDSIE